MLLRKAASLGSCRRTDRVSGSALGQVLTTIFYRPSHPCLFPLSLPQGPRSAALLACRLAKNYRAWEKERSLGEGWREEEAMHAHPREAKKKGEETQRLPPTHPTPSSPCALTRGFSRKASSPLSHLGSFRIQIRSPKQGSMKSPLLRDKMSGPGTPTPDIPPGLPPPTAAPHALLSDPVHLPPRETPVSTGGFQPLHLPLFNHVTCFC